MTRPDTVSPAVPVAPAPPETELPPAGARGATGRTALARALPIVGALAGIIVVWYLVSYLVLAPALAPARESLRQGSTIRR